MFFPYESGIELLHEVPTFDISEVATEVHWKEAFRRPLEPGEYTCLPEKVMTECPGAFGTNSSSEAVQNGFQINDDQRTVYGVLSDVCLFGSYQSIVLPDGRFLRESSSLDIHCYWNHRFSKLIFEQLDDFRTGLQKIENVVFRASHLHASNYGHFIRDSLSMGRILGTWLKNEDIISCFYGPHKFTHDFFRLFRPNNKHYSSYGLGVYVSELHFVAQPAYTADAINYIRNKSKIALPKKPLAVYLSRKGFRRAIANEDQLIPVLEKYQIAYVEPQNLSVEEQIRLFNVTDFCIGAWGAALCNCVFMPEKSIVIELCHPDKFDDTWFMAFSAWAGCHYAKVVGEKLPEHNNFDGDMSQADFIIPPDVLDQALNKIFTHT